MGPAILLGVRPLYLYYLRCLGQVFVCSLMAAVAFWLAPKHSSWVAAFSLIPIVTLFSASATPDGLLFYESMLSIACMLGLRERKIPLSDKRGLAILALWAFLTISIGVEKLPYILCPLTALCLLTRDNFKILNAAFFKKHIKAVIALLVAFILLIVFGLTVFPGTERICAVIYESFVGKEHILFYFQNFRIMTHMFLHSGKMLLLDLWGWLWAGRFSYGWIAGILLLFSKRDLGIIRKAIFVLSFGFLLYIIVWVGYSWMPVDWGLIYGTVWGVAFRYVVPFLPMLMLAIPFGNDKTQHVVEEIWPVTLTGLAMMGVLVSLPAL